MIRPALLALVLALALVLPVLTPPPVSAVSLAECQAYLCMPGGFPPSECSPAKAAVMRRLAALKPALPPWSSCAAQFGWDSANLSHTERWHDRCPRGGTYSNDLCSGTTANGCTFRYAARKKVTVQVVVDGATAFSPNHTHTQTVAQAGTPTWTCPPGVVPPDLPSLPPTTPDPPDDPQDPIAPQDPNDPNDPDPGCTTPPCETTEGDCETPPCGEEDAGCDDPPCAPDDCPNPPYCPDEDGGCADPIPGPIPPGGQPSNYSVQQNCPCPFGYPFRVAHWLEGWERCLSNPGRPGN